MDEGPDPVGISLFDHVFSRVTDAFFTPFLVILIDNSFSFDFNTSDLSTVVIVIISAKEPEIVMLGLTTTCFFFN
ncbi:hypothetical protein WICPIJ_001813 [Wickerhamomyces pijperi]|uniref:Uncharacterized protein n=1 Tax=Wickerhamomyces pijperi TaxID=599730 RepID=A0A9P8QAA1_WICPI|nr:hypothetical protein WICPIJ_001813 [Wickerhamomyces pijperi]